MRTYRNAKTGAVIYVECEIISDMWVEENPLPTKSVEKAAPKKKAVVKDEVLRNRK